MSLTIAVQMDPLETIKIDGDSTFALMLAAQQRGHALLHYAAEDLSWVDDRLHALARPVTVQRVAGDHFAAGEPRRVDLGRDVDVILMAQDPPCGVGYITPTPVV